MDSGVTQGPLINEKSVHKVSFLMSSKSATITDLKRITTFSYKRIRTSVYCTLRCHTCSAWLLGTKYLQLGFKSVQEINGNIIK